MYNLLVIQGREKDEWERNQARMFEISSLGERVFEWTDDSIAEQFRDANGKPDFDALIKLPCLFTYETYNVPASIGWISRIQPGRRAFGIEYYLPDVYPKLTLDEQRVFDALGMGDKQNNTRTRWEVKDIDLFEGVLRLFHSNTE